VNEKFNMSSRLLLMQMGFEESLKKVAFKGSAVGDIKRIVVEKCYGFGERT
jgi:hypothetical protein